MFPDFESEAPLERKITHERIALMDPASQTAVDFTSPELAEEGKDSYSVLRAPFDQWLASKPRTPAPSTSAASPSRSS